MQLLEAVHVLTSRLGGVRESSLPELLQALQVLVRRRRGRAELLQLLVRGAALVHHLVLLSAVLRGGELVRGGLATRRARALVATGHLLLLLALIGLLVGGLGLTRAFEAVADTVLNLMIDLPAGRELVIRDLVLAKLLLLRQIRRLGRRGSRVLHSLPRGLL